MTPSSWPGKRQAEPRLSSTRKRTTRRLSSSDNLMPGMSGIEAAEIILSKRPTQEIILCTAYLDDDLIDRASSAGVEHFLAKDRASRLPALIKEVVGAPPWPP